MALRSTVLLFALLWLTIMSSSTHSEAQAAGPSGCCTSFSRVRAVMAFLRRGRGVRCLRQDITEGCNISAIVLMRKSRKMCVDPTPRKMRKLLVPLCRKTRAKPRKQMKTKAI